MEEIKQTIQKTLELIGFSEVSVDVDAVNKKVIVFINEGEWLKKWLPSFVSDVERIANLIGKKQNISPIFVDINNYRKERENLIVEIAKAAARKATSSKSEVKLPAMNSYERRLVHTELSTRPDVKSESAGEGKERCVVVKPL
ncbi:MAG: spoIIIJ-associated protein [Parcubacteria group bacterium Gr01-1014_3]|nr:MAG: spoIIIJ-associated protein [Parcubacteria group bacterium Gr01-1014_3]